MIYPRPRAGDSPANPDRATGPSMMSGLWYRAPLSVAAVGVEHVSIVREHFSDALGAADWPDGACLFQSGNDALFFSPAAVSAVPHLIVACEAKPSPPPDRAGATLLAGRQSDWQLLPYERH